MKDNDIKENSIKNEYAVLSLICFILCVIGFLFPITESTLYVISIFLVISTLFSFVGIAVAFKIEDLIGKTIGLKMSIITFFLCIILYLLPFILNAIK